MKKACIVIIIALALLLGLSSFAAAADIVDSGTCGAEGDNLTWTLDSDGVLTISGSGAMADYSWTTFDGNYVGDTPWKSHILSDIISISIGSEVTSIGDYAFEGCFNLTSLAIPNSVISIGNNAFYTCGRLSSLIIPNSVTSIGDYAFHGCTNLINVTIGNSVDRIANHMFSECRNLPNITIPDSVKSIGKWAFSECRSLNTITIPNSVTSIDDMAFLDCRGLTSVSIPNSVIRIGSQAFYSCYSLTSVTIPNSVTDLGSSAFTDCYSLTSLTIGNSVNNIGASTFSGCRRITSVVIPNSVTSIGADAFYNCLGLISITIPNSVTSIGNVAFANCSSLTSLNIPNSVISIGQGAFSSCSGLTSVSIPHSVTSIGISAFQGCSGLTSVSIPDSVTSIGIKAFEKCTSLYFISLPSNISSIVEGTFDGCSNLTSITIPDGVTTIGDSAFANCISLNEITIPASVTSIGNWAFTGCSALTDVHYKGAPTQWNAVSIGSDNEPLLNAALHYGLEITSQPQDFTGKAGSTVRFTVGASGDGLTYQWYFKRPGETSFNKSTVAAATKKTFTMTMADKYDGYQYYCLVKDSHGGSVRSDTVTIHKAAVLAIATQPTDYYGPVGSTIKFTVSATGDGLTYQWYYKKAGESTFNKSTLSSATKKTFSMTMADRHDGWQYYCIVTDAYGDTVQSDTVTVHKVAPLSITSQPVAYSGTAGSLVKFTVTASGEGLTYQWYFKKTGASSFAKSTLASGTKAEYSMTLQDKHDGWQYYCLVKDAYGNSVKTNTVSIHVITPLDITALPQNFTGPVGSTAELDIEAEGEGLTYQWYYKTSALSAFTKSTTASGKSAHYRLKLAERHDGWKFYCVVSDAYGNKLRSNTVIVHVSAANELCIIKQPADFNGAIGQTANFTVKAAGEGLTYQWYYKTPTATKFSKCTSASGTTPTYSITVNTKHPGYKYYCIVKDAAGNSLRTNTVTIYITE